MHDDQLEDRLRQVLRAQGDALRLTVTSAELRRQHALRQRERSSRNVLLGAAAVLVLAAVAVSAALVLNRPDTPSIGTSPSPSASAAATASPPAPSIAPVDDIAPYAGWQTMARTNGQGDQPAAEISGDLPQPVAHLLVSAACNGIGILTITASVNDTRTVNCPAATTKPFRMMPDVGEATRFEVRVHASGDVRYQVLVEGNDVLLDIPAVVLRHGTDEAVLGYGCGGVISLSWGYDTGDSCGQTVPLAPLQTLELAQKDVATVSIDGWTIIDARVSCGRITSGAGSPDLFETVAACTVTAALEDSTITISGLPKAADAWVIELNLTARNPGGDSFSGPFYAYVQVR